MSTAQTAETIQLLERVGTFRMEGFDLVDTLACESLRARRDSALPEATAKMQGLVNILGDIERLLSLQRDRQPPPRLRLVEPR